MAVFYIHFDKWIPSRHIFEEFDPFEVLCFTYNTFLALYQDIAKTQHQQIVAILDNQDIGFSKILHEVQYWTGEEHFLVQHFKYKIIIVLLLLFKESKLW